MISGAVLRIGEAETAGHAAKPLLARRAATGRYDKMTTSLERGEKAGPAYFFAGGAGPVAYLGFRGGLASQERLDGFDRGELPWLPLLGDELVGAVVGGARVYAPFLVQPVALPDRHPPQPVNPDFAVSLLHADKRTKSDAERYARLMPGAMLRVMTNTETPAQCRRCKRHALRTPASRAARCGAPI